MSPSDERAVGEGRRTRPARENDVLAEICRAIVQGDSPGAVVQECAERLQRYFRTASIGIWFRRGDRLLLEGVCLPDREADAVLDVVRERWNDVPVESDLPVPRCMRARTVLRWVPSDPELAPSLREVLRAIDAGWVVAIPIFVDAEPVGGAAVVLPERNDLTTADELLLEQALGVVGVVYNRGILQERELRHRDRALEAHHMTAVGELAAGVAHQVNNPLNSILHLAALTLTEEPEEPIHSWTTSLIREARRATVAMNTLRIFARPGTGETRAVEPGAAMEEAISIMKVQLEQDDIEVTRTFEDVPAVTADPDRLRHVFHSVLVNARQAMEADGGGTVKLEVRRSGEMVEIGIEDTGPGMSAAVRDSIFRPFFTTRGEDPGAGMGLALAYRMVSEWDGEIIPGNWGHPRAEGGVPGEGGARVTIRLPAHDGDSAAAIGTGDTGSPPETAALPPGGLTVLIVEDEEVVGRALAAYLERTGSTPEVVESAEEALERLSEGREYDVIISDLRMPGMGGEGLVRAIRAEYPDLLDRLVLTSGDVVSSTAAKRLEESGLPFLAKPYPLEELAAILHRVVEGS